MILQSLVGLREGMMIDVARLVVTEATEVRLGPLLLLDLDVDTLDLVILHADLDLELIGHDESVSFN